MAKKEEVVMDFSKKSKLMLEFLEAEPSSLRLFEELVLKNSVLTVEEFFGSKEGLRSKLAAFRVPAETVDRIISFIAFDKIKFEGRDLVFLQKRDKELLYESFRELREEFDRRNFGKFNDRLYDEAMFWDEFFKRQCEEKSFLYGNAIDDSTVRNGLPGFVAGKLRQLPADSAFDLDENFDEVNTNQLSEKYTAVGNVDQLPLLNLINNHSLAVLYKNLSGLNVSGKAFDPEEDFAEFKISPVLPAEQSQGEPGRPGSHLSSAIKEIGPADKNAPQAIKQLEQKRTSVGQQAKGQSDFSSEQAFLKDFAATSEAIKKRLGFKKAEGSLASFFGQTQGERDENHKFIESIDFQISKAEASEDFGRDSQFYNLEFMEKYKEFNERTRHLLVIFHSVFPIQPKTDQEKVKALWKNLGVLRDDLMRFRKELVTKMHAAEFDAHKYPIDFLLGLLKGNCSKFNQNF